MSHTVVLDSLYLVMVNYQLLIIDNLGEEDMWSPAMEPHDNLDRQYYSP